MHCRLHGLGQSCSCNAALLDWVPCVEHLPHPFTTASDWRSLLACFQLASTPVCPLQVPKQDEASPYLTGAVTAAVLGTIAYRRPKALAIFGGMVALMTAPYLGFMVITVNRFGRVSWGQGQLLLGQQTGEGGGSVALLLPPSPVYACLTLLPTQTRACPLLRPVCDQGSEHGGNNGRFWQHRL